MAKLVAHLMIFCFALIFSIDPDEFENQSYPVIPEFFVPSQGTFKWTFGPHDLVIRRVADTIWDPGDVVISRDGTFGDHVESSLSNISFVLDTSRSFTLKSNLERCEVDCTKIQVLSHRIPEEGTDNGVCRAWICCCY